MSFRRFHLLASVLSTVLSIECGRILKWGLILFIIELETKKRKRFDWANWMCTARVPLMAHVKGRRHRPFVSSFDWNTLFPCFVHLTFDPARPFSFSNVNRPVQLVTLNCCPIFLSLSLTLSPLLSKIYGTLKINWLWYSCVSVTCFSTSSSWLAN